MNYFQGLESPAGSPQPSGSVTYRVLQTGLVCLFPRTRTRTRTDRQDRPSPAGYLCLPPSLPASSSHHRAITGPSLSRETEARIFPTFGENRSQSVQAVSHVTSSVGCSIRAVSEHSSVIVAASRDGTEGRVIPCSYRAIVRHSALFSSVNRRDGGAHWAHWAHCLHPDVGSEQSVGSWS